MTAQFGRFECHQILYGIESAKKNVSIVLKSN